MAALCTTSSPMKSNGKIASRPGRTLRLLILLFVGLSACSSPLHRPSVPAADGVTDDQRIAAMLSIHAHARWPDEDFSGLHFLPLPAAVEILTRDRGRAADSRRRRAIAKLVAYAPTYEYVQLAIAALLMNRADLAPPLRTLKAEGAASFSPAVLEVAYANLLVALTPDCPWNVPAPPTGGVRDPPPVEWSYDVTIPRNVEDIARALDPQSWDLCSPFFKDTHLVSTAAPCCPTNSGCSETGARSEPAGKPYKDAVLYERFCIADNCGIPCPGPHMCDIDFENLLCITTGYDPRIPFSFLAGCADRYDVDYHLASWISGELLGVEPAAIITDRGHLSARRATDAEKATLTVGSPWAMVHVDKVLDFTSSGHTGAVGKYLQVLTDELAGQIVEQSCCEVASQCWSACW